MSSQTMNLDIPSGLYTRLQKRAEHANRSVEDETLQLLAATVASDDPLADWEQTLASLQLLDNAAVEQAARPKPASRQMSAELELASLQAAARRVDGIGIAALRRIDSRV